MKPLYVKELSKVSKVSIRTLHYYDKIDLLKPSERLPNGYRVYSDKDVHKLEKIIALKFLGFTLARIQQLLSDEQSTLELLENRLINVESETSFLQEAQKPLLMALITEYRNKKTINWHEIAVLIVAYTKAREELPGNALFDKRHIEPEQREIWEKLIANFPPVPKQENI